jgi:hypothetical protein
MTMILSGTTGGIGVIGSGTAVASTSGTAIDFASLPTGLKRITVIFRAVSLSGTANYLIQLGAGAVATSGYESTSIVGVSAAATASATSTSGLVIATTGNAANRLSGTCVLTLVDSNTWVASHAMAQGNTAAGCFGGGYIALGGTLDRVRINTTASDTFDLGLINILYE